jgi:hypothetical protein
MPDVTGLIATLVTCWTLIGGYALRQCTILDWPFLLLAIESVISRF